MKLRQAIERHGWVAPLLAIVTLSVGVLGGARISLATQELSQAGTNNAVPTLTPWAYFPYTAKDSPPTPTPVPVEREWLIPDDMPPCVALQEASVSPGQTYFRLIRAEWLNVQQSQGRHHIYVEVLNETGNRMVGQQVLVENGGLFDIYVQLDKPANFAMYGVLCSYSAWVTELPSDKVLGMRLGTPEEPGMPHHTCFDLTFQRTTR